MMPLNMLTRNVKGLISPNKRVRAFRTFASFKADVACCKKLITRSTPHQTFLALSTRKCTKPQPKPSTGVSSLLFIVTPLFVPQTELRDPEGQYIFLDGYMHDSQVYSGLLLCPQYESNPFFPYLLQIVYSHRQDTLLIGRNSNKVLCPYFDKSYYSTPSAPFKLTHNTFATLLHSI